MFIPGNVAQFSNISLLVQNMSKLLILLMMVCLFAPNDVEGIWWWFSSDKVGEAEDEPSQTKSTEITQVFAPFEMSNGEEKFLRDAKNYLQNLPLLDQCNMLVGNSRFMIAIIIRVVSQGGFGCYGVFIGWFWRPEPILIILLKNYFESSLI